MMVQPQGFGPTKRLREGLVEALVKGLDSADHVWMPEIFYAGGTADRSISSADLVGEIDGAGIPATFVADRKALGERIVEDARRGDRVAIMGARDDSLTEFGHALLLHLSRRGT